MEHFAPYKLIPQVQNAFRLSFVWHIDICIAQLQIIGNQGCLIYERYDFAILVNSLFTEHLNLFCSFLAKIEK